MLLFELRGVVSAEVMECEHRSITPPFRAASMARYQPVVNPIPSSGCGLG